MKHWKSIFVFILVFQISYTPVAQAQILTSPFLSNRHQENKDVIWEMFNDDKFKEIIQILGSPEFFGSSLPWLVMGSVTSIFITHLVIKAERTLENKMFQVTFKEYAILNNPQQIDEYISTKGLLHFHKPLSGIDRILQYTQYKLLNGGDFIEINHLGKSLQLSRTEFSLLIHELVDVPLTKLPQYMDQLYIYGPKSYLGHPDELILSLKESFFQKSLLQRLKTMKMASIARHPKTISAGRWGLYFAVLGGVVYLSFRSYYRMKDKKNNLTLLTVTNEELAEMIENDYPQFEMYFLDQDPNLTQTMADAYREYKADPQGYKEALTPNL